jgi:hypothetical protein
METYIVQARCHLSKYTDVFTIQAESASDAVERWSKQQAIIGINTEYRWPNPRACKLEHFNPTHVRMDNMPANMRASGNNQEGVEIVQFSELTHKERQEYLEWLEIERNFERDFKQDYADGVPF